MAGIRLLETLVLNGPNYWSYRPCVWMRIDLGEFREKPSNQLDGFPRLDAPPAEIARTNARVRRIAVWHLEGFGLL